MAVNNTHTHTHTDTLSVSITSLVKYLPLPTVDSEEWEENHTMGETMTNSDIVPLPLHETLVKMTNHTNK